MWAAEWILQQAVPLSDDHFRARIVHDALWLRDYEDDPGRRLVRGFQLGRLYEQLETRRHFGGDIKVRRKAVRSLQADADGGRREHNRRQAEQKKQLREAAQQIAMRIWNGNPTLSTSSVARLVGKELQDSGFHWGERSIRGAISSVKPKRQ